MKIMRRNPTYMTLTIKSSVTKLFGCDSLSLGETALILLQAQKTTLELNPFMLDR